MFDGIGISAPLKMCLQIGLYFWGGFPTILGRTPLKTLITEMDIHYTILF